MVPDQSVRVSAIQSVKDVGGVDLTVFFPKVNGFGLCPNIKVSKWHLIENGDGKNCGYLTSIIIGNRQRNGFVTR